MRWSILTIAGLLTLAGCASHSGSYPSASPAFTPAAECDRNGGWWHADMNYCEYQSPGTPSR